MKFRIKSLIEARTTERGMTLANLKEHLSIHIPDDFSISTATLRKITQFLELDYEALLLGEYKEMSDLEKIQLKIKSSVGIHTEITSDMSIENVGSLLERIKSRGESGLIILYYNHNEV